MLFRAVREDTGKLAVVLDVDGVVVQSAPFTSNLEREYDIAAVSLDRFFSSRFCDCLIGVADLKDELDILAPAIGWKGTVAELMDFWFESENSPDEALLGEVASLRRLGVPVFLATNQERHRVRYMREEMRFDPLFDGLLASCELGCRKPDLEFYRKAADQVRSRCGATRIAFFDDTMANVDAAMKAGWDAFHYTSLSCFRDWKETLEVTLA